MRFDGRRVLRGNTRGVYTSLILGTPQVDTMAHARPADANESCNSLFAGEGEMRALMRSLDWSQTPLGAVDTWPQSLRTTVSILLNSRYPMFTFWGPQRVQIYNDAHRPVLGTLKHPNALGQPGSEIWAEVWDVLEPLVDQAVNEGQGTWNENMPLFMQRSGYCEETYFTFSYSPIYDESGGVGGVFCACSETTRQVLGERRLRTLRDLATQSGVAETAKVAIASALETLSHSAIDIPFALLYQRDNRQQQATLVGCTGLSDQSPACPARVDLTAAGDIWPLDAALRGNRAVVVADVGDRCGPLVCDPWPEPVEQALVLPLAFPGPDHPSGFLVLGISPRRALDDDYQGFLELVARQIASAIADARAYETERLRAESLAAIDRAKTTFFSNVSHEFRTPLTLMLAPAEDALADTENPLAPVQRHRLDTIHRNGLRLLKLVNTLLDFSRIEAGRIHAHYEPTDLAALTTDLASAFRSLVEQAGLDFEVRCPDLPAPAYVDRDMWEKIVLNLVSNAFKFTLAGQITVALRWCETEADVVDTFRATHDRYGIPFPGEEDLAFSTLYPSYSPTILLTVCDTGAGIPKAELSRLFERFHQVEGSPGRSCEGTGIGLSLVQELVKLHGGSVSVVSAHGRGSCFIIAIPAGHSHLPSDRLYHHAHETDLPPQQSQHRVTSFLEEAWSWLPESALAPSLDASLDSCLTPEATIAAAPLQRSRPHIVVADDNADMRHYLQTLLADRYQVTTVVDGEAALVAIRLHPPDLVLTDVMMPNLDGLELLRTLRADPNTLDLPIILLSARADESTKLEGLDATADGYLVKPFAAKELLASIDANLKLATLRRAATVQERQLRTLAEQAQKGSESVSNRLIQVLESMGDGFLAVNTDWRITYQNAVAERINGKPRTMVLGKTLWEVWPPLVGSAAEVQYRRAMTQGIAVHFEHHYREQPEYDLWFEVDAYPSPDGLSIFYRNVNDRKRAEATVEIQRRQLEQQLAEIETIYQSAPIGLTVIDPDLRFLRVNQRLADMNGLPVVDHLGRTMDDLLPHFATLIRPIVDHIVATGEPQMNLELSGVTPAQPGIERVWMESFWPLKQDNQVVGISVVCEEVTERKRIEAELTRSRDDLERRVAERTAELRQINADLQQSRLSLAGQEEQLRLALDFTHTGSWDWDLQTGNITWNDTYFRLLGLEPGTIKPSECLYTAIHPEDVATVERATQLAIECHTDYDVEYRVVLPDGSIRWLVAKGRTLYDEVTDKPVRMLGTIFDVSNRKQAETQIRASLAEKELLLKEVYHRVKNNLQVIYSLLNLQSRHLSDTAALSALKDSQSRVRAMAMVHEKLYQSPNLSELDLADYVTSLARSLLEFYRTGAPSPRLELAIEPCWLDLDTAIPCGLILTELLSNILKHAFTDSSQGEITIIATQHPPNQLCLTVRDNGLGLGSPTPLDNPSSLGLQLVRNLTQQVNGQVRLQPVSQGTEFQLVFPLHPTVPRK